MATIQEWAAARAADRLTRETHVTVRERWQQYFQQPDGNFHLGNYYEVRSHGSDYSLWILDNGVMRIDFGPGPHLPTVDLPTLRRRCEHVFRSPFVLKLNEQVRGPEEGRTDSARIAG